MIVLVVVLVAVVLCGNAVTDAVSKRIDADDANGFTSAERIVAASVAGLAMWLAANWALALLHLLTRFSVFAVATLFVIAAGAAIVKMGLPTFNTRTAIDAVWLIPVLAWIVFILWRGAILPPLSHDALAYHLPKAAMMFQAHGFEQFAAPDPRIVTLPANYELLLTDVMLLTGSDQLTEWIGTLSYVLVLCVAAALAQRWWRDRAAAAPTVLATAMVPLFLLHSGADKNDLLSSFLCAAAVMWGARWSARSGRTTALLLVLALVLAAGTKPNAAAILVGLAPFLAIRAWREIAERRFKASDGAAFLAFCIIAFLLCGGASYVSNWTHAGAAFGVAGTTGQTAPGVMAVRFGDWQNLWQVPYLILTVPFSGRSNAVWVPWKDEYWFWPRYEIYFSHYGALFTILLLLVPVAVWFHSRVAGDQERRERTVAGVASLIAVAVMLPVQLRPVGFFGAFPRYFAFVVPLVAAITIPALFAAIRPRSGGNDFAIAFKSALVLLFVWQATEYGSRDRFAPARYVRWMTQHHGSRDIFFNPNRAASVVDRIAGPTDAVGVYGGFDTWVYPAYGRKLTRQVAFLSDGTTPAKIPSNVQWVVIDRSWNKLWSNPNLTDLGKFWMLIGRGTVDPADIRPYEVLRRDARFKLLFRDDSLNQAVFWRIGSTPRAPRREELLPELR